MFTYFMLISACNAFKLSNDSKSNKNDFNNIHVSTIRYVQLRSQSGKMSLLIPANTLLTT